MKSKLLSLVLILAVAAIAVMTTSAASAATEEGPEGLKLFTEKHKCNMCHAVPAADIEAKTKSEKMKGPDLGGKIEGDFKSIAAYLRKTGELDDKQHTKEFKGTDEELQAIIDWLGSLEAQE